MSTFLTDVEGLIRKMIREEVQAVLAEQNVLRLAPRADQTVFSDVSDRLLSALEVAEILGVSPQRVYELARRRSENGFPVIILGARQYRFSRNRLIRWLEERGVDEFAS